MDTLTDGIQTVALKNEEFLFLNEPSKPDVTVAIRSLSPKKHAHVPPEFSCREVDDGLYRSDSLVVL